MRAQRAYDWLLSHEERRSRLDFGDDGDSVSVGDLGFVVYLESNGDSHLEATRYVYRDDSVRSQDRAETRTWRFSAANDADFESAMLEAFVFLNVHS